MDALVLPGGESSTIDRLLRMFELSEPLRDAIASGLPTLGTCAGLVLLAREVVDPAPGQRSLGVLDVTVRRNAFGSQVDSAEVDLATRLGAGAGRVHPGAERDAGRTGGRDAGPSATAGSSASATVR